ncbi:unnamed protein product, partial [Effrenium voratum]
MRLAVNTVIKACAAAGDLKKAEEWLQRLQDMNIQPNAKGIVKVADAASKAGDLERCQFWFQECDRMGFPEEQWLPYLGITLNAAGPAEQLQLREMLQARGLQLTGRDYTRMITALAQTGDTDGAEEVLNEIQRARLSPYLPAYTSVLEAYAKLGDLPGAERAFRGSIDAGLTPDVVAYGAVMSACARARENSRAVDWMEEASAAGLTPNLIMYNTVLDALVKMGQADKAEGLLEEMERQRVSCDVVSYTSLMSADPARSQRLLEEMREKGLSPDQCSYEAWLNADKSSSSFGCPVWATKRKVRSQEPGEVSAKGPFKSKGPFQDKLPKDKAKLGRFPSSPFGFGLSAMISFPSHKWLTSALWALPLHATWDDLPVLRHEDYEARVAKGLRIFIYDLPDIFHKEWHSYLELMARNAGSNCDWMLSHCTETSSAGKFSIYRQLGQEVIILRKLLAGPTVPPEEADIFVVPALIGSACFSGLYSSRCSGPADGSPTDLHSRLPYYNSVTRHRHLFLASLDKRNLPLSVQAQTLLVSMGASYGSVGHFVVPLAVTDQEPPPKPRTTLVYLAMVPNNHFRQLIYSQLEALSQAELLNLNRSRTELHNIPTSNLIISAMGSAMFCVCPPAENSAAGSKRLYDAIFAGCVPVVISFPTAWGSGISWWRTDGAPLEFAMPFPWEIDWRRLAVEVSEDELLRGELGARLANFPMTEFLEKQSYLLKVRRLLLYDMNGGQRDAFSVLMEGIRNALPSLYSMGGQPIICETIPLSHGWLGRQLDKKWSSSFGELACSAQSFWRRSSAFWTSAQANTKVTIEPLRVSQFQLKKVDAGLYFYQATSYIVEGHSQPGSLAICENADFPEALHESGPQGPRSLRDSTACRYAAALGASSAVQLVMPLCNSEPLATSQSLNLAMQ